MLFSHPQWRGTVMKTAQGLCHVCKISLNTPSSVAVDGTVLTGLSVQGPTASSLLGSPTQVRPGPKDIHQPLPNWGSRTERSVHCLGSPERLPRPSHVTSSCWVRDMIVESGLEGIQSDSLEGTHGLSTSARSPHFKYPRALFLFHLP